MTRRAYARAFGIGLSAAMAAAACGGASRSSGPATTKPVPADAGADALASGPDPIPSLDALAARGAADAPLMREAARTANAAGSPIELRMERDVCVRAAFGASRAVRAWFEDDAKAVRGESTPLSTTGLVPPRGPACARKGETLRLVAEPGGEVVRAVVWQAP